MKTYNIPQQDFHPDFYSDIKFYSGMNPYVMNHIARYMHTLKHMPNSELFKSNRIKVLEIGTSFVFPQILKNRFKFDSVDVTHFTPDQNKSEYKIVPPGEQDNRELTVFNLNLEHENIPRNDETYDMILCFEVIEHMEIDPMFLMSEINRVLKKNGLLYLTTPNSTSSRNVFKILNGDAPHFHMKYTKTRDKYRHNIEYSPSQLLDITNAAGFKARKFWTEDNFEQPIPEIINMLAQNGYPTEHRGDNMLYIGEKKYKVKERFPSTIYE